MRILPLIAAFGAIGTTLSAQANCSAGMSPPLTLATQNPFAGGSLYGHPGFPNPPGPTFPGFSFVFDMTPNVAIDISQIDIDLYDAGGLVDLGNGTTVVSPNQVGATATVTFFIFPGASWVGNETNTAAWGALGTGTLTVAGAHAHSPIVFNPPINLPPGLWGVAIQVPQTTTGPNPGPLHPMVDPLTTVISTYADTVVTIEHLQFQRESWTNLLASPAHTQNLEFHYTAASDYSQWTSFGAGCVAPNAPVLGLLQRPQVGTTINFQTSNIQPGTLFSFNLFGFVPSPNGTSLAQFGLPGCNLYLQLGSPIISSISTVTAGASTTPITIPSDPSYAGIVMFGQSAPMTSGANIGFYASNGVCVAFGLY
ncbi:MAG: hypothetical protein IT456_05480 [Planctomycetes bacterium]|nr:hypothetical protein [Planctomycetota bacterium]